MQNVKARRSRDGSVGWVFEDLRVWLRIRTCLGGSLSAPTGPTSRRAAPPRGWRGGDPADRGVPRLQRAAVRPRHLERRFLDGSRVRHAGVRIAISVLGVSLLCGAILYGHIAAENGPARSV